MSKEIKAPISSVFNLVSSIQRGLLYLTLFIIPWFVIPLPYDSSEKIKSVLFISLTSLLILLEIIKWIWDGKISIIKSSFDKIFLLLFSSFLLSFVFAQDSWISFWGYDGRIGRGFFAITFLFLFFYLSRGILQKREEIIRAIEIFSLGLLILIILSVLSVLKVNIFAWIPYIRDFFVVGLPLTFSFQEIMLLAGGTALLAIFLLVHYVQEKKYQVTIFPALIFIISLGSIPIFSINQGALVPILFFVITLLVCLLLILKLEKSLKAIPALIFIFSALVAGFSVGFQFESFRTSILGESFTTLNPIRLGSDISWVVASSSVVNDFFRGLVGMGNDSFAIAYNAFRPATDATIALGNTSFITGSNEVFTILANRGFIGVTIWIVLGFVLARFLINEITTGKGERSILTTILGLNLLLIYLGSIFLPFSFLTYFIMFALALLLLVYSNKEGINEEFLLKFWAVNIGTVSKDINKTLENVNWFLTMFFTLLVTAGLVLLTIKMASVAYVVRAESYNTEQSLKFQEYEEEVPFEERDKYLVQMAAYYNNALRYDSTDPFVNRKAALISLEIINLLSEQHTDATEEDKKAIMTEVSVWKNAAIDLSKEATSTSQLTYANWNTRASVYLGLVSLGFSDYSEDALSTLQVCVNLNPLDYDSYYKAGQIFMLQEDYDQALNSFNKVLNINQSHVPSLVLAANILSEKGDKEGAIKYLTAAKQILEINEQDSGDMYDSIVKGLEELGTAETTTDTDVDETEEVETTPTEEE
ncbi:MAG: hypothetical protein UR61_C0010G0010 [candidate division WS6 bacterium GW2011_GWE1_34_7]|uniref:Uncharacterized protein n=1 Tax=candidate division WS6 bacterium GW2011_GWE1_34_7 TaxID=1619093 RepID=A0A0G0B8W4_9BACT|nr:MAG: hypothetical protein UR61_C0010G0010 [candidate division WS6 bacterium GW2011_GWE1_34_7]